MKKELVKMKFYDTSTKDRLAVQQILGKAAHAILYNYCTFEDKDECEVRDASFRLLTYLSQSISLNIDYKEIPSGFDFDKEFVDWCRNFNIDNSYDSEVGSYSYGEIQFYLNRLDRSCYESIAKYLKHIYETRACSRNSDDTGN